MKQLRDPFLVKFWWVSWTHKATGVRVADRLSARTRTAAVCRARRDHPEGTSFRVGPWLGGVEVPEYHQHPQEAT